jgi:UDP-glucose 4-epimerase
MRILITGGAGFIGSTLADACLAQGHDVAIVDDFSSGSEANVPEAARLYRVDIRTPELHEVLATEQPELVSHHAAQVSVKRSVDDPAHDAEVNVLGTLNVLEAARRHGVRRLVFASTGGAIYGEPDGPRADEDHPRRPQSPYAIAKLAAEHYLEGYRRAGLETVVLRYANVYGPRQDPHGEAGVVAIFIERILAGLPPTIFGDGEQVRDFVYVDDVVRANLLANEAALTSAGPAVFNVGTGRATSVNALWAALAALVQPEVSPHREPARTGDLLRSVLDVTRARTALGWEPEVDVVQGLARTWEWFAARAARARVAA